LFGIKRIACLLGGFLVQRLTHGLTVGAGRATYLVTAKPPTELVETAQIIKFGMFFV